MKLYGREEVVENLIEWIAFGKCRWRLARRVKTTLSLDKHEEKSFSFLLAHAMIRYVGWVNACTQDFQDREVHAHQVCHHLTSGNFYVYGLLCKRLAVARAPYEMGLNENALELFQRVVVRDKNVPCKTSGRADLDSLIKKILHNFNEGVDVDFLLMCLEENVWDRVSVFLSEKDTIHATTLERLLFYGTSGCLGYANEWDEVTLKTLYRDSNDDFREFVDIYKTRPSHVVVSISSLANSHQGIIVNDLLEKFEHLKLDQNTLDEERDADVTADPTSFVAATRLADKGNTISEYQSHVVEPKISEVEQPGTERDEPVSRHKEDTENDVRENAQRQQYETEVEAQEGEDKEKSGVLENEGEEERTAEQLESDTLENSDENITTAIVSVTGDGETTLGDESSPSMDLSQPWYQEEDKSAYESDKTNMLQEKTVQKTVVVRSRDLPRHLRNLKCLIQTMQQYLLNR